MKRRINLNISSIKLPFDKKARLKLEKLGINVKESYVPMKTDREKLHLFLAKKGHCLPFVKIVNKKQNASTKIAKVIDLTKTNNNDQSQKKRASAKDKKSSALKIKKQRTKAQVQQVRQEKTVKIKTTKGSKKVIPNKEAEDHKTRMEEQKRLEEQKALRAKRMEMREKKREEAHWPVWETLEEDKPLKNKASQKETLEKNKRLDKKVSEPNVESSESNAMDFSFNISDSDEDSEGEEKKPAKPIPKWAQAEQFNEAMKKQCDTVVDLYLIFDEFRMPDLSEMFTKQRKRFKKRTSSAVWECPPENFRTPFSHSCS